MNIRKYNEFYDYKNQSLTSIDRHNIASISDNCSGIENLILWIGCKLGGKPVVKISNNPEDLSGHDLFSISLDNFDIIGVPNKSFIDVETIDNIISFITKNKSLIIKFTNEEIFVDELVDELVPYQ
jgi:hypothetical protein